MLKFVGLTATHDVRPHMVTVTRQVRNQIVSELVTIEVVAECREEVTRFRLHELLSGRPANSVLARMTCSVEDRLNTVLTDDHRADKRHNKKTANSNNCSVAFSMISSEYSPEYIRELSMAEGVDIERIALYLNDAAKPVSGSELSDLVVPKQIRVVAKTRSNAQAMRLRHVLKKSCLGGRDVKVCKWRTSDQASIHWTNKYEN